MRNVVAFWDAYPRDIPSHLMVGLPLAFDHIPYFVLLFVLTDIIFLLEVNSIVILRDMVDDSFVTHAFEHGSSANGSPATVAISISMIN
jgi:hypothetical protein